MSYDFSFDKKSVFFLLGGSVAIGVLLFFAGFIVGWDRGEYAARLELENTDGSRSAQKQPATLKKPAQTALPAAPQATSRPAPAPAPQAKEEAAAPAVPESKPSPDAASQPKQEKPASPGSQQKPQEQTVAQAAPEKLALPQASSGDDPPGDDPAFSLQLGAFQNEHNALRFKDDLKSRGYPAFVFNTPDAGGRVWHTVRLGHYPDMKKAAAAAAVFTGKEKLPAFVRPGNEL